MEMVTLRGEAFWQQTCSVLTGAVGTQVYTRSSSRRVHFMQIIAHIKRNVLKGCSLALALPSEVRPCARRLCWKWVLRAAAICLFPAGADLGQEVIVWPPGNELSWGELSGDTPIRKAGLSSGMVPVGLGLE